MKFFKRLFNKELAEEEKLLDKEIEVKRNVFDSMMKIAETKEKEDHLKGED